MLGTKGRTDLLIPSVFTIFEGIVSITSGTVRFLFYDF